MAEDKKTDDKTVTARPATSPQHAQPAPQPPPRRSATADATESIRRVGGVTAAQAEELAAAGVDPKLDNRTGDQRPAVKAEKKPQQVKADG